MKRASAAAFVLALAALGPVACSSEPDDPQVTEPLAPADPDAPPGLSVASGRMTLPAVAGNPGAVYFTIANHGESEQTIRSASVSGAAMAMLHQSSTEDGRARMEEVSAVTVPVGESVAFAPGGLHIMAMQVDEALQQGDETEVTLTFASGDKVSFPAEVVAPGQGDGPD